jgi:kinesin family protein C2/C3
MFCRTRPNHLTEKRRNSEPVSAGSERIRVKLGGIRKDFKFDKVFPRETSQG